MSRILIVALIAIAIGWSVTNDSFHLLPKGDIPGVMELMQKSVEHDKVQAEFDQYDAWQEGAAGEKDQKMVNAYYNMATDFYEYGWGESFHFAHTLVAESHEDSIARHEHRLADNMGYGAGRGVGKKILDVGCGVGGPAREVASYSGAHVTGITLNRYQVERGLNHTKRRGLENQVTLLQVDFTKMSFETGSYDAAYAIESTCHAPKLADAYSEIYRVLKPGGKFIAYEWITTATFDAQNPLHNEINKEIEYGNGLPPLRSRADVLAAAAQVGLTYISDVDLAQDHAGTRPWYHKLDMGWFAHKLTHFTCQLTEFFGLAPPGTVSIHGILLRAADGLVRGGKYNTFTPMHMFIFEKSA